MEARILNQLSSWLYHNDHQNKLRFKLYKATESKHPVDEIDLGTLEPNKEEVRELLCKSRYRLQVSIWKKMLRKIPSTQKPMIDKISNAIGKHALSKPIEIDLSFEEMDIIENLK